jgi:hypothetical protein
VAKGFDHQDRNVDVTTRIFLVDLNGNACTNDCDKTITQGSNDDTDFVNFDLRATYLFKYDAVDAAGNHAEQVVFALILDDTEAPLFEENCEAGKKFEPAITVEAVSDWTLCQLEAQDNVDATTAASTYKIQYLGRSHAEFDDVKSNFFDANAGVANLPEGSDYATASAYFTPQPLSHGPTHVGKYLVTISTVDAAGVYGHNAMDNVRSIQQAILIRDTVNPTIYLSGSNPEYVECRKSVADGGRPTGTAAGGDWDFEAFSGSDSDCRDQLDTFALGRYLPVTTTLDSEVYVVGDHTHKNGGVYPQGLETRQAALAEQLKVKGTHSLDYTCEDFAANEAATVTRTVNTVDTHQPTLTLLHDGNQIDGDTHKVIYQLGGESGVTNDDATDVTRIHTGVSVQASCEDSCDASVSETDSKFSMSWGPRAFNAKILGDYVRTYTCSDVDNNIATKTRTYTVVDNDVPEITMMLSEVQEPNPNNFQPGTFEASRDVEYTDTGATCHDFVDGELSHAVEVSGEVVNMRIPGSYTINYDCQDLSGNSAPTKTREIVVVDTTQPFLKLSGAAVNYVEAGFPYIDAGATATDTLDGDITQYIWTDGNTVVTKNAFYAQRSCTGIKSQAGNAFQNGEYYITIEKTDQTFARQAVHCFAQGAQAYTYYVHSAGEPVDCPSMGMLKSTSAVIKTYAEDLDRHPFPTYGNLDNYLCTVVETNNQVRNLHQFATHEHISNAEQGKYIINFRVEDKAGNHQFEKLKRTIIVKDTLPPVITLQLNKKLIHTGKGGQMGVMTHNTANLDMTNPAGYTVGSKSSFEDQKTYGNPNMADATLMAESTSTNGWLIGAVASAVAGVALLGFSARKDTVSVPV